MVVLAFGGFGTVRPPSHRLRLDPMRWSAPSLEGGPPEGLNPWRRVRGCF
jgi:hypothetical protein